MVIFGISSSERPGALLTDVCPHCGERGLVAYRRFRYFLLFFLPVLPLGSALSVHCEHCHLAMTKKDLHATQQDRALQGIREIKRPRWHFVGTVLVAGIIAVNLHNDAELEEKSLAAAAQPQVGDIWVIDVKDSWKEAWDENLDEGDSLYRYSTGRVSDVRGEEVELSLSDWSFTMSKDARKDALDALSDQDEPYFIHDITIPASRLVALQASNDFRLLR